jgi:serine/threonine-protein kinase
MSLSAATPRVPDLSGHALEDRYELHALIGEGTFGRVYRGRDRRLARSVAVKVIKPWWSEDPEWAESFEREAQLTARVSDPRIVQIFDVGWAEEGLYYVAELVDGESLAARLRRGSLEPSAARKLAEQLSRALASAHAQRVVHGDVKPANVLIATSGQVKITDFGLARLLGGSSGEAAATVAGTPSYMAPEQARGRGTTPASDVYSAGVVLYEMLAGQPPFAGGSPVEVALRHLQEPPPPLPPSTPRALAAVVERALAKEPEARYRDGGEMAQALARARSSAVRAAAGGTARATPAARATETPLSPAGPNGTLIAPRWSRRRTVSPAARRRTLGAFGLVVLVLIAMSAGAILTARASRVRVPDLHGLAKPAVSSRLERIHLRPKVRSRYSLQPSGTAIAQAPAPGSRLAEGSSVTVIFSSGPPPVAVPRVLGFSSGDAMSSLAQLGLRPAITPVPAPGVTPGTVTGQTPSAGSRLLPGSAVSLSVAETPRWRSLLTFTDQSGPKSPAFQIRGSRWRIVYRMAYSGTCTFLFFCSGPSAHILDLERDATVSSFDLGDGGQQIQSFGTGRGTYQVSISPGDDSATWSMQIQDYY